MHPKSPLARRINLIWRVLASLLMLLGLAAPAFPARAAASDPIHANSEIAITLDGTRDAGYIKIAEDPSGDLSSTGPGGWIGTHWTDLTALYVAADASNLYVYVDLPAYYSGSDGQIGLIIETDSQPNSGGSTDPWGNDIDFTFTSINSFTSALPLLPDYVIRGDISTKGGWTELRTWNGANWNTGASANWGGISGGALIGTHVAYSYNQGVEFSIPLADIGSPNPADIKLQFFGTQEGGTKGAFDTLMNDDQTVGWDDATTLSKLVSVPLAVDPDGDLASSGPGDAPLVAWTDMTAMHVWASHNTLYVYFPMPDYDEDLSEGQIGLTIDTQPGGGSTDPWNNAITWAYTTTQQNLGSAPILTTLVLPDYVIRGNIYGPAGDGWTELRAWNGANFNTGTSIDWGGIGNSGEPSQPGSKVAWSNNDGLRLAIPFADIGVSAGDEINLQFLGTQGNSGKGAYDTVPSDDQSLNWDDPTTQKVYATYQIPFIDAPIASHDNSVWWAELGHNSRDPLYRTPGGPVTTGTAVTLRLRAAAGDLTAAQVRVWNDRLDSDTTYNLALAASDTQYDWWEVTLPASPDSTIYWYRFIAIDGTDIDYYEDDSNRTGGWGQAFDEPPDNSWQLTIYKDGYTTPEWVKNAIFYQIFPDRFRDGDLDNHTPAGTAFYDEPDTVFRSNQANWNQPICDPRDAAGPCPGAYSQNFYGGDLQGILDQLDYIEELGITAIYLNPIFESPSNHKYDATDYSIVDDNFGDLALFESLVQGANARGIRVILDGVFNHTSSDSIYFDRYGRYDEVGACESHTSPYRDWYYFTDVTPGTGPCVSSTGVANGANYESWWGYDSLPKLDSTNDAVRALIYSGPGDPIAMYWVDDDHPRADGWRLDVGADVDPGTTNDPENLYWDEFRTAVHTANPEGYIVGEEWNYGTAWLVGDEWDAVMNYKFSTAVLGFWREGSFTDNDHNTGSSAGPINELTPSQLNERLLDLQERYPAEALYAMLNLLGSHDTNRALFMLDSRTGENNTSLYNNPAYDWSDAIERLRGTAILQLTLPGAPTIYYGDEVGLVGPTIYAGGKWEDDPYNRQPFPWLDLVGDEPFYDHLTTPEGQDYIRDHYILLTTARNNHPALRTGSFDPLLVDDTDLVYAYGRKEIDTATPDAAVVILNRDTTTHTFTYDLSTYLPAGTVLTDALDTVTPYTYTVQADGSLSPALNVSPMFGAVLVLASGSLNPPAAPLNLLAAEGISQVDLAWDASTITDTASYNLYRSPLSGGGYELITNTTALTYTDIAVVNSTWYYYVVTAVGTNNMESGYSNEAAAMPHYAIDNAFIQWPPAITHTIGLTPTENIYGRILIAGGVTAAEGPTPGLLAQVGFGPTTTHPLSWTWWSDAVYNTDDSGYDEFMGSLTPEYTGEFGFAYRFSTTRGRDWAYAGGSGFITDTFTISDVLTVDPSTDVIAPTAPLSLTLSDWDSSYLELTWQPATDETSLYAYDVFRSEISGTVGTHVGRVTAPATVFTDTGVTTDVTYYYVVQALDTSFNRSGYSNEVEGTPEPKVVQVTFNVGVPAGTPGTVYIVGDHPALAAWSADALPMTYNITDSVWTRTIALPDGQPIQFKFTRGSWDTVEWWGSIKDMTNRQAVIDYGTDGTQVIDLTATDWGTGLDDTKAVQYWRDPYVIDFAPADLATMVSNTTAISVTWSKPMTGTTTTFDVEGSGGPIPGLFGYHDATNTTVFTPSIVLPGGSYTVTVAGQTSADGQSQQIPTIWHFTTAPLPLVQLTGPAYSAAESAGPAVITAALNASAGFTVTVDYFTNDGTALAGADYTAISGSLTFAPGETELLITVNITDDIPYEGDEAFTVTLTNPVDATLGSPTQATVTILDDEALPTVQLAASALSLGEADGPAMLTVTLSGPSAAPVTVDYLTSDGTALAGEDYAAANDTLTFAPGETELLITLNLTDDLVYEGDEAFTVSLTNPVGAALGSPAEAAITIIDDEALPTVQLAASALSLAEADGPAVITITLSGPAAAPVTVDYATANGTALAGEDYAAASGSLTFAPGETEQLFTVNITDDLVYEGSEAFTVSLTNPVNASLGSPAEAAITIIDDEALPTVQLAASALSLGEADGPALLTVTLSGPAAAPVTVDYLTSDGTALAGDDYTALDDTLTFAPGETQKVIAVAVANDTVDEGDETFTFTLANPVGASLGTPAQTSVTIIDNDEPMYRVYLTIMFR